MKAMRRILGILVMIAGILGLVISLAGLVGVWVVKPTLTGYVETTISTLNSSIDTSQKAMEITGDALGATVDSIDALSSLLSTTADSVEATQPILEQINVIMGVNLPSTMESATDSLKTAQQAAQVLDTAIKSLDTFRVVLSSVPLVGAFVSPPTDTYEPDKPLADSLGEIATNLEGLPAMFNVIATDLDKADDNLVSIQENLTTMAESVARISSSLSEYEAMVGQSQASMENLKSVLTGIQDNLSTIMNVSAAVLSLFFLWLMAAQVVILSQGWELYQGTAGRMEGGEAEVPAGEVSETIEESEPPAAEVSENIEEIDPGVASEASGVDQASETTEDA